jgi:regulator of protease activity HflC (stomatin/prohibitin superfamily)
MLLIYGALVAVGLLLLTGARIVRPTGRGLIERFGKYRRLAMPGFNWIIPLIDRMFLVNVTEVMVNAERQEIITSDKLNARVDAQVYFKVKSDEESVKNSQYNVFNYQYQIVNLARTTLRNIIGTLTLKSANSERGRINSELQKTMREETTHWGIEIVRTELKEIDPPPDVQETMNRVVKAENEKVAAIDFATATETMADGARRAEIKKAEGVKQAKILEAEGEARAIQLVNEAADKYFVGNAQLLRRLIAVERALATCQAFSPSLLPLPRPRGPPGSPRRRPTRRSARPMSCARLPPVPPTAWARGDSCDGSEAVVPVRSCCSS